MPKRPNLDSCVDLGRVPLGLEHTSGRCNYQWAIEGPRGAVIFYCTNEGECSGDPHKLAFNDEVMNVELKWRNAEDAERRRHRTIAIDEMSSLYSAADAATWLESPHKLLNGACAIDLLGTDRAHEVFAIIDQLRSGAYV